jgi:hypothetical protein
MNHWMLGYAVGGPLAAVGDRNTRSFREASLTGAIDLAEVLGSVAEVGLRTGSGRSSWNAELGQSARE